MRFDGRDLSRRSFSEGGRRESRPLIVSMLFIATLLLLRSAILLVDTQLEIRKQQSTYIRNEALDPAALFYTELSQALAAEKEVRASIHELSRN